MLINRENLDALYKGYRTIFFEALQGVPSKMVQDSMMVMPTSKASEVIAWLGAFPGMREFAGEALVKNLSASNWEIFVKTFEDTVAVKREDIERDSHGVFSPFFQAMGAATAMMPEEQLGGLFVNGFTAKCYTGKAFFAADHKAKAKGLAFSNLGTKKLSAANYEDARASIKGRRNAEGRAMNLGRDLVLVVSPDNEALGRSIVVAEYAAGGASNVNKGTSRLEVWPQLAGNSDMWFIYEAGYPYKPFIRLDEVKPQLNRDDNINSREVMLKQNFLYQGYARMGFGYLMPELAWGSTGEDPA